MSSVPTKALTCTVVAVSLITAVLFADVGKPNVAQDLGEKASLLMLSTLVAAGACAWMAKRSKKEWSWLKFVLIFILVENAVAFVGSFGSIKNEHLATNQIVDSAPLFSATWPSGWAHSSEPIKSTTNEEEVIGTRDSLRKLDGPGVLLMTASCVKWESSNKPDIDAVTKHSSERVMTAYKSNGFAPALTATKRTQIGAYDGREYEVIGTKSSSQRRGITAIAFTPKCEMTLSFISEDDDYEQHLPEFRQLQSSIH